jgi:hypothetical protein
MCLYHGTKRQFARCKTMSGVGVKPTCRLHVQTFQFDPQETSNAEFARSKDVDNLLELIAMPWRVSKPNTTDPS